MTKIMMITSYQWNKTHRLKRITSHKPYNCLALVMQTTNPCTFISNQIPSSSKVYKYFNEAIPPYVRLPESRPDLMARQIVSARTAHPSSGYSSFRSRYVTGNFNYFSISKEIC